MKDITKNISWIIIVILLSLLFIQRECTPTETVVIDKPVFIYDTDTIEITTNPKPIYIDRPGDTIRTIDTIYINDGTIPDHFWKLVGDYYSRKYYDEIIINDSSAYLSIKTSVYANSLQEIKHTFVNKRPVDAICPETRLKLFVGGQVLGSPTQFGAGPSIALLTKRDGLYSYNYDVINNTHSVSMFYKLSFR